eukprot:4465102-Prymnesium_polylepis.1
MCALRALCEGRERRADAARRRADQSARGGAPERASAIGWPSVQYSHRLLMPPTCIRCASPYVTAQQQPTCSGRTRSADTISRPNPGHTNPGHTTPTAR